jgi:PD-(D/E)XK nuclease superfamily
VAFVRPEGSAQSDLGTSFEDRDDHDVGHPDGTDEEGDGTEAQEEIVEGTLGVGLGNKSGRGLANVDLVGGLWVGGCRKHGMDCVYLICQGTHVDGGGVAVKAEVSLGGGEPNQHGAVDRRSQDGRLQDACHVEPLAAHPDPLARKCAVDPEALSGDRLGGGGGIEVPTLGHSRGDRREEAEAGRDDAKGVGVNGGDERTAIADNQQQRTRSEFFDHIAANQWVSTTPGPVGGHRLTPQPLQETPRVTLSFSELKYLFECSYQFKLRFLYGFNAPIHEALGYEKGLHDALAEIHKRALEGDIATRDSAPALIDRHLNTPFAYPALREQLRKSGIAAIERYFDRHGKEIANTEFSEKQIQVHVAPGITVDGRIDLIRRLDTDEVAIVDFKSTERAQPEDVTRDQLHVYAVGYQELTGKSADLIEVLNLDDRGKTTREPVDDPLLAAVRDKVRDAGEALRTNNLPRLPRWHEHKCGSCDLAGLCRKRPQT